MRHYFCDCCGVEVTDKLDRHVIVAKNRKTKKSQQMLVLCPTDAKRLHQIKIPPQTNVRKQNAPAWYLLSEKKWTPVDDELKRSTTGVFIVPIWNLEYITGTFKRDVQLRQKNGALYYTSELIARLVSGEYYKTVKHLSDFEAEHNAIKVLLGFVHLLWRYQTDDERKTYETKYHNNRGFNKSDAKFMSAMARLYADNGYSVDMFSDKQIETIRKRFRKYQEQVSVIVNERLAEEAGSLSTVIELG